MTIGGVAPLTPERLEELRWHAEHESALHDSADSPTGVTAGELLALLGAIAARDEEIARLRIPGALETGRNGGWQEMIETMREQNRRTNRAMAEARARIAQLESAVTLLMRHADSGTRDQARKLLLADGTVADSQRERIAQLEAALRDIAAGPHTDTCEAMQPTRGCTCHIADACAALEAKP